MEIKLFKIKIKIGLSARKFDLTPPMIKHLSLQFSG